ncbi:MAG: hypothetical protein NTV55_09915 [Planctomycetota bacterium]|nr:hypothetical protein [Planctomycetota bacterium]
MGFVDRKLSGLTGGVPPGFRRSPANGRVDHGLSLASQPGHAIPGVARAFVPVAVAIRVRVAIKTTA